MHNLRGIALVVFSMAAFSVEDALIKLMTQRMPTGQVMLLLGLGGSLVFLAAAGRSGAGAIWILRALRSRALRWRTLGEAAGALSFVSALALIPLSTVAAVFQATPLAVTAGAALFFGETVGWRRWAAVAAGFLGVLMIIRPGLEGFRPEAALVLVTVVAIAARDLLTRRMPVAIPSTAVAFHGFLAVMLSGAALLAASGGARPLTADLLAPLAGAILCGTSGYYAIVAAMRLADASALMPFRYARLVFSLILGLAFFAERPDGMTLAGAALIVAAAFYTYQRERRLQRIAARPAAGDGSAAPAAPDNDRFPSPGRSPKPLPDPVTHHRSAR